MKTLKFYTLLLLFAVLSIQLTAQNPSLIKNLKSTSDTTQSDKRPKTWPVVLNGIMYFFGGDGNTLYRSDGSDAGTYEVKNVGTGGALDAMGISNGTIYFNGYESGTCYELWKSNGTGTGTVLVKDIVPGPCASYMWSGASWPSRFTYFNNYTYFKTYYCERGCEDNNTWNDSWVSNLMKTNGTSSGTTLIKQFPSNALYWGDFVTINNKLIFRAADGYCNSKGKGNHGQELWRSDGTSSGTVLIKDIYPGCNPSTDPNVEYSSYSIWSSDWLIWSWLPVGNTLYFGANDGANGMELWKTDGTTNGTVRITNINPAVGDAYIYGLTQMGQYLYFAANDGTNGMELWRYSLDNGQYNMVADINPDGDSDPVFLTVINNYLFFVAKNSEYGMELWRTDGTEENTQNVTDINPGSGDSWINLYPACSGSPGKPIAAGYTKLSFIGDKIIFSAYTDAGGFAVWQYDISNGITSLVKDFDNYSSGEIVPKLFTRVGEYMFFYAYHPDYGWEWWKYDPSQPIEKSGMHEEIEISTKEYTINIHPNPANDQLFIEAETGDKTRANIRLLNLLGQELMNRDMTVTKHLSENLNISSLSPGVYILDMRLGNEIFTQKIVKK